MFDINIKGLAQLEAGRDPAHLAFEAVANVFDEARGYGNTDRKRPDQCNVALEYSPNPRGIQLTVYDNGAGFENVEDIWTLFGETSKRSAPHVSGRFNSGEKLLIAAARSAMVMTNKITVKFEDGQRDIIRHREENIGTMIQCLMPWTKEQMGEVRTMLARCIPPDGLAYRVDGVPIGRPPRKISVFVTLPTVHLAEDGVMRRTVRKSRVDVFANVGGEAWLYELGIPVCPLGDVQFPWSLDVQQKVPVPQSRDMVESAYLTCLIGRVLEQAALDGCKLLDLDQQESGFVKDSLEYITKPEAMQAVIKDLFGDNVVRESSDTLANARAAATGATIIPGRWLGRETRKMLDVTNIMPTAYAKFGGGERTPDRAEGAIDVCPSCFRLLDETGPGTKHDMLKRMVGAIDGLSLKSRNVQEPDWQEMQQLADEARALIDGPRS
jgi:hypothetical protein